jgi:hypothetical protein
LQTPVDYQRASLVAGVDVGGGQAETVVYLCECGPHKKIIVKFGASRGGDARGDVVRFLQPYREHLLSVRVDAIGIGHNFGLHLRDHRFPVELVNVSRPCNSQSQLRENDPARRFANDKALFYQGLADALEHDELQGLSDETTIGQLAGILYKIDSHGRLKIEPRKERERGVPSPDRAEALMLALCKHQRVFEYHSVRELRNRESRLEDDDPDDYRPRGRWDSIAPGRLHDDIAAELLWANSLVSQLLPMHITQLRNSRAASLGSVLHSAHSFPQPELKRMNPPMPRAMQKSPSISNCSLVESRIDTRLKRSRIRNVLALGPFVYASLQKVRPMMMMAGAMTHLTNHGEVGG